MSGLGQIDLLTLFALPAMGVLLFLWLKSLAVWWWKAKPGLPLWHLRLRQEWNLSLLRDRVLRKDLERKDEKLSGMARTHFHEQRDPEKARENLLFNPVGMLKKRPLPDLLRQAKEKAYLKKVLKDLP